MLQLEIFAAILQNKNDPNKTPVCNFFNEDPIAEGIAEDGCIFFERNVALLRLEPTHYSEEREQLCLSDIYTKTHEQLQQNLDHPKVQLPILVKTYAAQESVLLMNKYVEIVGLIYFPKDYQPSEQPINAFSTEKEYHFNNFYAPVLHALTVKPIQVHDRIPREFLQCQPNQDAVNKLHKVFLERCGNDQLLSQILLYSVMSLVTNRPHNMPIDVIPLNVYNIVDEKCAESIKSLLKMFCSFPIFQKVTLQAISKKRWYGKKNYDYNCIQQGLNLHPDSTLVLEETNLEAGTLYEVGVKNASLVNGIVQNQKIYYDFDYCTFEAESNCGVISLSQGRSIFDFEYRVRLFYLDSSRATLK